MTAERPSPHAEVPKDPSGRPDDRFDGTDSGPDGWDTPYPPRDPDAAAAPDATGTPPPPPDRSSSQGGGVPAIEERSPTTAVDPTSYETDGPDEPADTPQR
jgi:hypothetical protein